MNCILQNTGALIAYIYLIVVCSFAILADLHFNFYLFLIFCIQIEPKLTLFHFPSLL